MKRSKIRRKYLAQPLTRREKKKATGRYIRKSFEQFLLAHGFANGMNGSVSDDE